MSLQVGDIPMSQALQGSANLTPAYDAQKTVFQKALALLDTANSNINSLLGKGQAEAPPEVAKKDHGNEPNTECRHPRPRRR